MSNRRVRLLGLTATAFALTVLANVLTEARLTTGLGVLVTVEIAGGVAISRAAIAVVRRGGGPLLRAYVILSFGLLGAIVGADVPRALGSPCRPWHPWRADRRRGRLPVGAVVPLAPEDGR